MPYLGLDHLVLLVSDFESARATWEEQLGLTLHHHVHLEEHGIHQAFFPLPDQTFIELIAPSSDDSPIKRLIEENGEGLHVLAMRVKDLPSAIATLKEQGAEIIGEGTPRVFVKPQSRTSPMIQLWPQDRPHRWRDSDA
jgi:methylmalonyl-CoA/ethylmalonyl-CoA epimerase